MHNVHMIGVQNLDKFSLRGCFLVIGTFGIVVLISYFNELAKAGLLSGHPRIKMMEDLTTGRGLMNLHDLEHAEDENPVILQKDGGFHHLDLNLLPLQREARNASHDDLKGAPADEQEIQIALHLGKDENYVQKNTSSSKIYQYHNILPNFFTHLSEPLSLVVEQTLNFSGLNKRVVHNFTQKVLHKHVRRYRNRTKVLLYQHDPEGYAVRDCLLSLSMQRKLIFAQAPLNAMYRKNWEKMSRVQKEKFEILYGGLSFGACESMSRGCSYAAIISHPLDRLLQAYWLCSTNSTRTMCRFLRMDNMTSVHDFLEHHGSSFFQKLLYYSRHCRLVGQDEVCIHDNKVFFVLSHQEKEEFLAEILQNIERWFSVVGLMEDLQNSLNLLQTVIGLKFADCLSPRRTIPQEFFRLFHDFHDFSPMDPDVLTGLFIDGVPYNDIRATLLENKEVQGWLFADIAIYNKFVEIFRRQLKVYNDLKRLKIKYYTFPDSIETSLSKDESPRTMKVQDDVKTGNHGDKRTTIGSDLIKNSTQHDNHDKNDSVHANQSLGAAIHAGHKSHRDPEKLGRQDRIHGNMTLGISPTRVDGISVPNTTFSPAVDSSPFPEVEKPLNFDSFWNQSAPDKWHDPRQGSGDGGMRDKLAANTSKKKLNQINKPFLEGLNNVFQVKSKKVTPTPSTPPVTKDERTEAEHEDIH